MFSIKQIIWNLLNNVFWDHDSEIKCEFGDYSFHGLRVMFLIENGTQICGFHAQGFISEGALRKHSSKFFLYLKFESI